MSELDNVLCCCEYLDVNHERSHLLACCCNCVDLDEAFESVLTGQKVKLETKSGLMSTLQDRIRIPWRGGAKQVALDAILPVVILPTMFLLASISLFWTCFVFSGVTIFLWAIFRLLIRTVPKTRFFFVWTNTSGVLLYTIFQFVVIPFLEINVEENVALSLLIAGFVLSVYVMRRRSGMQKFLPCFEERYTNCRICEKDIWEKDHHCVWLDCCVGKENQCLFLLALFFGISALLYSSNLTLTSVCHPFTFYKTILLPDDCSEVYFQFELALSFVSALYSLGVALLMVLLLSQQVLLISLGLSQKEWHQMPLIHKVFLGLAAKRPSNQGLCRNWCRIICWRKRERNYSRLHT